MDFPDIQIKNEPNELQDELYDSQLNNKIKIEPGEELDYDYDYFSPEFMASIPSEPLFPDLMKTDSELFSVTEFLNADLSPITAIKTEDLLDATEASGDGMCNIKKEVIPTGMVKIESIETGNEQNCNVKNTGKLIIARPKKTAAPMTSKPYTKSTNTMECQYCGAKFSSAKWFSKHFCPQMGEQLHGISVVNMIPAPQKSVSCNSSDTVVGDAIKTKQRNIYSTRKCRICDQSFPTFSLMFEHFMSHYEKQEGNKANVQLKAGPSLLKPVQGNIKREFRDDHPEPEHPGDCDKVIFIDHNGMRVKQPKYAFPDYSMKLAPPSSSGRQGIKICKECGESFKSQSQLVDHFLTHYNLTLKRNPPVSQQPTSAMVSPSSATVQTKKPNVIYSCNQCTSQFPSISRLKQHQQTIHSEEESVQCKVCDSWFNSQKYLVRHMQRKHEATAECNVCHQKFTEMELPKHYLKHFNMKI